MIAFGSQTAFCDRLCNKRILFIQNVKGRIFMYNFLWIFCLPILLSESFKFLILEILQFRFGSSLRNWCQVEPKPKSVKFVIEKLKKFSIISVKFDISRFKFGNFG